MFAAVGAFMHVVAGSLMVHNWRQMIGPYNYVYNNEIYPSKQYTDMLISAAVFTFVNAVVFVAEIIAVIRYAWIRELSRKKKVHWSKRVEKLASITKAMDSPFQK